MSLTSSLQERSPAPVVVVPDYVHVWREHVPAVGPQAGAVQDLLAHEHHVQPRIEGHLYQHVRAAQLEPCPHKGTVHEFPDLPT